MKNLKSWREKFGISQKKLAEFAKINLTTLRQFEIGGQKPHKLTISKIKETMQKIETNPKKYLEKAKTIITKNVRTDKPEKKETDSALLDKTAQAPSVSGEDSVPIRLSNLDLELIKAGSGTEPAQIGRPRA